ncbi:phage late control D family protein [Campylobacter sp. US33a]|uniref:phage late control D family protein n=1 Tax=Campylobacter sp. US33a TaxID=2498120 RepID=UPI001068ACE8|nr:contractile injection system protein, VgrG/Pvc8 family [Campylobacter sp. US33a]TEY01271.1 phage tail protein [Campylobacter sp. US33a]
MVKKPQFKLVANDADITEKISKNLISISFEDKEKDESDEISLSIFGLYSKPLFGDSLELWLGLEKLFKCGTFSVATVSKNYTQNTTEVRATAVNFSGKNSKNGSGNTKEKKSRSFENTTLFAIARKIASENGLKLKSSGEDQNITSVLQNNESNLEFFYKLSLKYGFICCIKENTLIITPKDAKISKDNSTSVKNENLPSYEINLNECFSLEITESSRNEYTAVIAQWQDTTEGKTKSIKVGSGENVFKMQIAQPKSDNEAFKFAQSKLNELQKGGVNGRCELIGREIRAGGKLKIKGIKLDILEFSIKSVSHSFNDSAYVITLEFES